MRIGEIESLTGLSAGTIRYWEERGLVSFDRAGNSYRDIPDSTVTLLKKIKLFRELGIAIADIKLWRDGLVVEHDLLSAQKKKLAEDSRSNLGQIALCGKLIEGGVESAETRINNFFTETPERPGKLALGVDIGTTSVSAKLISLETGKSLHTYTLDHHAAISPVGEGLPHAPDAFAADAERLLALSTGLVRSAVDSFPEIVSIGFTGQMHGIVLVGKDGISPLYTWQNQFGKRIIDGETICERIKRLTGYDVPTGYGLATYFALKELGAGECEFLTTIADLAVAQLCGLKRPLAHPTNAASLGFFDLSTNSFDIEALGKLGIDPAILPETAADLEPVGEYRGIKIAAAIGDNQAGVFGSLKSENDILVNIGTSGQVSFIGKTALRDAQTAQAGDCPDPACETRPYPGGKLLCSGSTLCGGRAYALLADLVGEILGGFGVSRPRGEIYAFLNESAGKANNSLRVTTTFSGTRGDPSATGTIAGITTSDLNISELSRGFLRGMVCELYELYGRMSHGKFGRLVVSGNAMRKNPTLREITGEVFGSEPLVPAQTEEAAFGAALYGAVSAEVISMDAAKALIGYK